MKPFSRVLCLLLTAAASTASADSSNCCLKTSASCNSTPTGCFNTSGTVTRWYKAKDGTLREQVPYWTALSRAEDADDLEIKLRATEKELADSKTAQEAAVAAAANEKAELEAQLASLKKELEAATQQATAQKERADKAEAAVADTTKQLAESDAARKTADEKILVSLAELKTTTDERDVLKTANAELQKQVAELTEARTAAEALAKSAQDELERIRQDAATTSKPEVQEETVGGDQGTEPKPEGTANPDAPKSEPSTQLSAGG